MGELLMLTLAMIVKNESKKITRCLESATNFVDEIVIVDTGSVDDTKKIALSYGARVFDFKWNGNFSDARNFALQQCSGDWSLFLDADEYIIQASRDEVNDFININNAVGRIRIINRFYQDGQTKESQCFISRLIPRGSFFEGRIHEQVISDLPRKNVPIHVYHDGYYNTDKSHRNLKLLRLAAAEQPNDNYLLYQIGKENRIIKNFTKAREFFEECYNSITPNDGFKPQLIVEYLYTIINLNDYEKGLAIIGEESALLADFPDFHFVCGLFFMELVLSDTQKYLNYLPMIEKSYITCMELGDTTKYDSVLGTGSFYAAYNLAVFYETNGDIKRALTYYEVSGRHNYKPAIDRNSILNQVK